MLLALNDGIRKFGNSYEAYSICMNSTKHINGIRGVLKQGEPMAAHTSWRTGGPVDEYFEPVDLQDLCHYLVSLPEDRKLLWVGLGSNLLVRDGGFHGSVIAYNKSLNKIEKRSDGCFHVEAGVPCAKVAKFTAKAGYTGAEFLAGIPGTMGGALAMNAGAFGNETWNIVDKVKTVNRAGEHRERSRDEFQIAYRTIRTPGEEWFVSADIKLENDQNGKAESIIRELLDKRSNTQPVGLPSCGSVFRNPPGDYAARLVEQSGLKGKKIGNACISEKHANFIINLGGATSEEIENLILLAQKTVYETHGVKLETEVKIVGEKRNITSSNGHEK